MPIYCKPRMLWPIKTNWASKLRDVFLDALGWSPLLKNYFFLSILMCLQRIWDFNWIWRSVSNKWHDCTPRYIWHYPDLITYFHSKMCLWKFNPLSARGELWSGAWSLNIAWLSFHPTSEYCVSLNKSHWRSDLLAEMIHCLYFGCWQHYGGHSVDQAASNAKDSSPEWLILVLSWNEYCCCFHCPNHSVLYCS